MERVSGGSGIMVGRFNCPRLHRPHLYRVREHQIHPGIQGYAQNRTEAANHAVSQDQSYEPGMNGNRV